MVTVVFNPVEVKMQMSDGVFTRPEFVRADNGEVIGHMEQVHWAIAVARHEDRVLVKADLFPLLDGVTKDEYPEIIEGAIETMISEFNWVFEPGFKSS